MGCSASNEHTKSTLFENAKNFHHQYALGLKIGRGAFAQVRVAERMGSSQSKSDDPPPLEVAVKIVDLRDKRNPNETNRRLERAAVKESTIWASLGSHPHCVQFYDAYFGGNLCYMVMEKCSSDLFQYFERMLIITERHIGEIFRQMLSGIVHVHSCKIIHRDIKPDNFLIGDDGVTVKLCDFGLSTLVSAVKPGVNGTAPFICPEILKRKKYDEKVDIWSFGVLVYAFLFGSFPYSPKQETSKGMKQAILEGRPPTFKPASHANAHNSSSRSTSAVTFVKAMLARDPEQRPAAHTALHMEFMTAVKENRHALGVDLPSLRSTILAAQKIGAIETRNHSSKEEDIDDILNKLQIDACGQPLPTPERSARLNANGTMPSQLIFKRSTAQSWDNISITSTASPSVGGLQSVSETSPMSHSILKRAKAQSWEHISAASTFSPSGSVSLSEIETSSSSCSLAKSITRDSFAKSSKLAL
mmetsp:Transcript_46011/g.72714  ORF Transcript_46011/g.72714 Transcript_46011/m.72714 type:complete len:474 (-) Transcript_46011:484-1905(-)